VEFLEALPVLYSVAHFGYGAARPRFRCEAPIARWEDVMNKGSYAAGLAGGLCGVLLALLAIFVGAGSVLMAGGEHASTATHGEP